MGARVTSDGHMSAFNGIDGGPTDPLTILEEALTSATDDHQDCLGCDRSESAIAKRGHDPETWCGRAAAAIAAGKKAAPSLGAMRSALATIADETESLDYAREVAREALALDDAEP